MPLSPLPDTRPHQKVSDLGVLAIVVYGSCILVTLAAGIGYYTWSHGKYEAVAGEADRLGPIAVGSLWVPTYPNVTIVGHSSSTNEGVTETTLVVKTQDPPDKVIAFFKANLRNGHFRLTNSSKTTDGGIVQAAVPDKKARVAVIIRSVGDGSEIRIIASEPTGQ